MPQQVISNLRFDPTLPVWLLAALGALCLIALAPAAVRRARGAGWRFAAFAVLLAWLAGPRLVRQTWQDLPDIALMVVDHSGSMGVGNRAALAAAAQAKITREAARIPGLELRTVSVPEAGADGTRLFAAIDHATADIPRKQLAGVIAITDGQVHDVPKAAPFAAPFQALLAAKGEQTDRRIRLIDAPRYGVVGHTVTLRYVVEDLGVRHPGGTARLTIRRDGAPPVVERVPIGQPQSLPVKITRAGPTVVALAASTLPGEVSTVNNQAVAAINGVRERLHVLLVSGQPDGAERAWRRLLKSDPAVDLVHFTILRPPEKDDMTPLNELALIAFPVHELFVQKIKHFDLIILDRFQNDGILPSFYLANIARYVRDGGALLMSVGPEFASAASLAYTPLASILPAAPDRSSGSGVIVRPFRPRLTALGRRAPVTADLRGASGQGAPSWGHWYRMIASMDVRGQTLMRGPDRQPLLVLNRVGKGRVAMLLSDQMWLWARGHDGGGPEAELMRRVSHWLMKEPALEENALTATVQGGQLRIARRTLAAGPPGPVTVVSPDGARRQIPLVRTGPGEGSATLPAPLPGLWRVSDGVRTAFAAAGAADPPEWADLRATASKLAPIVAQTGGSTHWLDPAGAPALRRTEPGARAGGSGWIGLRRNHAHLVTGIATTPLVPPGLALPLILGLAVLAWRREGT